MSDTPIIPLAESPWFRDESPRRPRAMMEEDQLFGTQPLMDMEGLVFLVMFLALLFLARLGTYGALLFTLTVCFFGLKHRRELGAVVRGQWLFLVFPAFALFSALWSETPLETIKHGAELMLTIFAALLLPLAKNRRSLATGMFLAFAIHAVLSLAVGSDVAVGTTGGTALAGLEDSKNEQADSVTNGALISIFLFWAGLQSGNFIQCLAAAGVAGLQIYSAILARSAGATLAFAVGVSVFLVLVLVRKAGQRTRLVFTVVAGMAGVVSSLVFLFFNMELLDWVSGAVGKDVTLTGRTYLWARARDLVMEQPILGRGFAAFWQQGNLDAEGLWQYAHITSRQGFNFHNTSYDILVSLGWIGMLVFGTTLIVGFGRAASRYVSRPSLMICFWLAMGIHMAVRMPVETMGTYEFNFSTVILFAVFAFASARFNPQPTAWQQHPAPFSVSHLQAQEYAPR